MVTTRPTRKTRLLEKQKMNSGVEFFQSYFRSMKPHTLLFSLLHPLLYPLLYRVSPVFLAKFRYRIQVGKWPAFDTPRTFDEKLLWLMLYWRNPLKTQCADKYGMRSYVEGVGSGHLLVDLIGVYEKSSDIDFATLPDRFVLKCTHGCGFNIICWDKKTLDVDQTRRQLDAWMRQDYSQVNGEIHYAEIKPRIQCERFLDDGTGALPADYKLHCFHGKLAFTTVCKGRDAEGHGAAYDHYDRDWRTMLPISKSGVHPERWSPSPECYPDMLAAAEALSKPFPYVRMDFYGVGNSAFLGEMTFTPAGCIDSGYTDEVQTNLGDLIQLPERLQR